ncbi:hypothetical protein GCM10022197_23350 [Microlunatus spumicola]|uniref:Transcriptional regulator, AbiEi antitoxin, Type IV TA system n=1 Tax=Microlunatus spumicola TaxID=81499 RepID=A0ABP6XGJ2_9ACTN
MEDIRLARELVQSGLNPVAIRSAVGTGSLRRVRRGAYVEVAELDDDPTRLHRRQIVATLKQGHPRSVVSHGSAAVLRSLGVPRSALDRVHLTRDRQGGGQRRAWLQVHGHPLPPEHVSEVRGIPTTTLPRTVVDLACVLPLPDAVAVGDGALRLGATTPGDLEQVLATFGARRGVGTARRALGLLDGRSESYGESVSRVLMLQAGLPAPEPQLLVRDERGVVVARVDFAWPELGVVGEFDGRVKYGRSLAPDEDPTKALWREKVREDLIRDLGWQVVRWIWADLDDPAAWFARLERAFARGHAMPV